MIGLTRNQASPEERVLGVRAVGEDGASPGNGFRGTELWSRILD
jgi:hypothetical protein